MNDAFEQLLMITNQLKSGGEWLGRARAWLQSNVRGGDTLTWGSGQPVQIPFCKMEEYALAVAVAAVAEDRRQMRGPGTPTARFERLIAELEARFPHPNPFDSTKTPEQYMLEAIDHLISSNAAGIPLGWTPWEGRDQEEIPPNDTYVQYKMADGDVELNARRAGDLDWSRGQGGDWEIVAYKVVVPPSGPTL